MPVRVVIPTRLRASPGGLAEHNADALGGALEAAAHRALVHSRVEVLEKMGGRALVQLHKPELRWTGERVGEVGPDIRAAIEQGLAAALMRAADRAGLSQLGRAVSMRSAGEVGETFDPARFDPARGTYVIPSYQQAPAAGTGQKRALPVQPPKEAQAEAEAASVISFEPETITANSIAVAKLVTEVVDEDVLAELELLSEHASPDRPLGVIYRGQAPGLPWQWQVAITDGGPEPIAFWFESGSFARWQFMGARATPMFKKTSVAPAPGPGTAEIIIRAADPAGFRTEFLRVMKQETEALIKHVPTPATLTTNRFYALAQADIEHSLDAELARQSEPPVLAIRVQLSTARAVICVGASGADNLKWQGEAKLTTIVDYETKPKKKQKRGAHGTQISDGREGGSGKCPRDDRPDDHPPDDVEDSLEDVPFLGEPALDEIGDIGVTLKAKIATLAAMAHVSEGKYAGRFCYRVASALLDAATATQTMSETATGENAPSRGSRGNMGVLDFTPSESPIIARIRELGRIVSHLGELMEYIGSVFEIPAYECTIHGIWRGEGQSWALRFREAVVPVIKEAVGEMFIGACRSMLLQLLATSLNEIVKRTKAMPRYAVLFERWIVPMIADMADLEIMRMMLRNRGIAGVAVPAVAGVVTEQAWIAATGALVISLKGNPFTEDTGEAFVIVSDQGVQKIRDRHGRLWSADDLEQALALRGQIAEGADPLVKQIIDLPEAKERFRDAPSVREELITLLDEMLWNNHEMTGKATSDAKFAFESSQIDEDIPSATIPGSKYALQGIHKVAHEQIGDAFRGSGLYGAGLDDLFDSELGKRALKSALILSGFVLLCVLVPGGGLIAFAAGGALAVHELAGAYEKERLYGALIDPDLVLTHADVEAEKFAAWFGVVLSVIPEGGAAVKGLIASGKAVIKGEAKSLGKIAAKAVAARVAKELAEYAVRDLLSAFLKEAVLNIVISQVIEHAMAPLTEAIQHEASIGHGTGSVRLPPPVPADPQEQEFLGMIRSFDEP